MPKRRIADDVITPVHRPGDLLWTVFPWPELFDLRAATIDLSGIDQCVAVQVRVCMRQEDGVGVDQKPPYIVQFAEEEFGEQIFGRFGRPADSTLVLPQVHLAQSKKDIVERAAAGLQVLRDQLNAGIDHLYTELL